MKVLLTCNFPDDIVAPLLAEHEVEINAKCEPMDREELLRKLPDKGGLICTITEEIDSELLNIGASLRMIANFAVGFNNIDVSACSERGVWVSNTPGVLTDATADLTFGLILSIGRRIVEGDKRLRAGEWKAFVPFQFLGTEVHGKTLGIIGLGHIGTAVARRTAGFEMTVLYHKRRRIIESEEKALGVRYADFNELLQQSDFVSLHVPLNENTHHMIGANELDMMKSSAYLINVSRGPVVNESALVTALRSERIAGAALDVYENEPALAPGLADLQNVILLPHIGSATMETRRAMASLAVDNLLIGLRGHIPPNCLNPQARS
jgi:glyoxylate reductase